MVLIEKRSCWQLFRLVLMLHVEILMVNDRGKVNLQTHHILHSPALHSTVDATPVADILRRHCRMALGSCSRLKKSYGQ